MIPQDFLDKLNKALGLIESDNSKEVKLKEIEDVEEVSAGKGAHKPEEQEPKIEQMKKPDGIDNTENAEKSGLTKMPRAIK